MMNGSTEVDMKRDSHGDVLGGMARVEGLVAVVPSARSTRSGATAASLKGVTREELERFRASGWTFETRRERALDDPATRPVYKDRDGRLKIGSGSLTVKFAPEVSEATIQDVLASHGLSIRRRLGFAPNLFTVAPRPGGEPEDCLELARKLTTDDAVAYAEPVLVEAIEGREG